MEETEDRKGRDERAIRWLVSNMTEDAEMESFTMAIPGSFNSEWGLEVWKDVSNTIDDQNKSTSRNEPSRIQGIFGSIIRIVKPRHANDPLPNTAPPLSPHLLNFHSHSTMAHITGEDTVGELSARVVHVLETLLTCKNRNLFTSDELRLRRTRAFVETTASLVCCAGAEVGQFGDIVELLGDIGSDQNVRESLTTGKDLSFVMRWTCLSLVAIRRVLDSYQSKEAAQGALQWLGTMVDYDILKEKSVERKINKTFDKASGYLNELCEVLGGKGNLTEDKARQILRSHESQILELEHIDSDFFGYILQSVDRSIRTVQCSIDARSHGITRHLPGVNSDDFDTEPVQFSQFIELFRNCHKIQFIFPLRNLKRIRSVGQTFRDLLEGQWDASAFQETCKNLQHFPISRRWWHHLSHRQLRRLKDLRDGGGLGFAVELFFLVLKELLSKSDKSSSKALYVGTFRAITSDWSEYKHSLGTQKLLLNMVMPRGLVTDSDYPDYIVDEFMTLLGNILKGQTGPHIDSAVRTLTKAINPTPDSYHLHAELLRKAFDVITQAQESSS